jgi:hypothetical protein
MGRPKTPAADYEPVCLRLPPDLLDTVRDFVAETGVPLNTAMIQFLRRGVETPPPPRKALVVSGASSRSS